MNIAWLGAAAAAWVRQARARPDMSLHWSCCGTPAMGAQTHARVAVCSHCGAAWRNVAQAKSAPDWRPLGDATAPSRPLRTFDEQRAWKRRKLRDAED